MYFRICKSPTHKLNKCRICDYYISKGELCIHQKTNQLTLLVYHLNCQSPKVPNFIRSFDINKQLREEAKESFEEFVKYCYSKVFTLDSTPIISVKPQRYFPGISLIRKRTLIEVFKFLPASIVHSTLPLVSKEFYEICWDFELWQAFLLRDFNVYEVGSESKKKYIELYNNSCIGCKSFPSPESFYKCPLLKRKICLDCLQKEKFQFMCSDLILEIYGVNPKLLNLDYGTSTNGIKLAYAFRVENEVYKFREIKKGRILEMSQVLGDDHEFVQLVKSIDVRNLEFKSFDPNLPFRFIYREKYDESIGWKFFREIQNNIRTGKGRITKEKIWKKVNEKFQREDIC